MLAEKAQKSQIIKQEVKDMMKGYKISNAGNQEAKAINKPNKSGKGTVEKGGDLRAKASNVGFNKKSK